MKNLVEMHKRNVEKHDVASPGEPSATPDAADGGGDVLAWLRAWPAPSTGSP